MGDFNVDLLKSESHEDINNILHFQLQILQPTRITEHSAFIY